MRAAADRLPGQVLPAALALLTGLVLAVLVWTGVALLSARSELQGAERGLSALADGATAPEVDQVQRALADAEQRTTRAHDRLSAPGPALLAAVPLLGQVVDGPRAVAAAGRSVSAAARTALEAVTEQPLLERGGVSLARLEAVRRALDDAARSTADPVADLVATRAGLVPPVDAGVRRAQGAFASVPSSFADGAAALTALRGVLGGSGERSVLVVLMNNAEQRGGGGVVTVFAQGTARDGRLTLDGFSDVFDVADAPEQVQTVPAPADYRELWGPFLADTTLWRNATMSPHLPGSLQVLAGVSRASTPAETDVVIALDVRAVAAVLSATSPAELPDGSPLTGDNAVQQLLLEAYTRYPDDAVGQTERRRLLRGAADAVADRLLSGEGSPTDLAAALSGAAAGRHLALWSARPDEQAALEQAGLAGEVLAAGGDLVQVATQNFGQSSTEGNKLDYFVRRSHRVDVELLPDRAQVTQEFTLRNGAPQEGLPGYVLGYSRPGEITSLVSLAVPDGARVESFRRGELALQVELETQTDHVVLRDVVDVGPGEDLTWQVRYTLPRTDRRYRLAVVPQALAFDAELEVEVRAGRGVVLAAVPGSTPVEDGVLHTRGPLDGVEVVEVDVEQPSTGQRLRDAVRRFWNEPVELP